MNKFAVVAVLLAAFCGTAFAGVLFARHAEPEDWSLHARASPRTTIKFRVALKHKEGMVAELEVRLHRLQREKTFFLRFLYSVSLIYSHEIVFFSLIASYS